MLPVFGHNFNLNLVCFRYRSFAAFQKHRLGYCTDLALQLVCKGSETECENLMKRTLTTHQHNLQLLMIEIYKTKHSLNPTFMRDVFAERNNQHNVRN